MLFKLVWEVRVVHPCLGGKKLYKILSPQLQQLGVPMGRDKFFDFLRKYQLLVKRRKQYVYTTQSDPRFRYKNKLKNMVLTGIHQAFVCDITYLRTRSGFVYLFLQTDAYSRKITGWSLSNSLCIKGAIAALKMTIKGCNGQVEGAINHSDKGLQYGSKEYFKLLKVHKMEVSMTEENHCYENSIAERVNGILKQEYLLSQTFENAKEALRAVREAIESYNSRPHWSLNLLTPNEVHNAA